MPLALARGIGLHQIFIAIGKNGIGELPEARDAQLSRNVAIESLEGWPHRICRNDCSQLEKETAT
jgi:hypothetical protein